MENPISEFYAGLTPFYHLIYADWEGSIERQAAEIDALIKETWGRGIETVLDAACGIGTQCLGLAKLGYELTASDLSFEEIERAKREADSRGLDIAFSVADMRRLYDHHRRQFDVVIACDNAIPHLLTDEDILLTFRQFHACTRHGGGSLISVRDYEKENLEGRQVAKLYGTRRDGDKTYLIFQNWNCQGKIYDLDMYFIEDGGGTECRTHVMRSRYYAVTIARLMELMAKAGFKDVTRLDEGYFQPVIVGIKH